VRDPAVLLLHAPATVARLAGVRAVIADLFSSTPAVDPQSLQETLPRLRLGNRVVAGVCALLMRPRALLRAAIVLKPSTLLRFVGRACSALSGIRQSQAISSRSPITVSIPRESLRILCSSRNQLLP
jgi:hypothetical protein